MTNKTLSLMMFRGSVWQKDLNDAAAPGWRRDCARGGQAAVELALIMPIVLFVLLLGIQYAIIGTAALGLGQANYQGARYAATNTSASQSAVQSYMVSVASPLVSAGSGQYLSSSLSGAPPCTFGNTVTVSVTLDIRHLVALPNPFFGIPFPTSLTNSTSAFCE
jgi:Flp pilus assembly protein TadG